jgi:hypothetical protein
VLGFILAFLFLAAIGKAKGFKQVPRWWIPQALCIHRYEGSWRVGPMVRTVSPDLDVRPAREPLMLRLMRGGQRPRAPLRGHAAKPPGNQGRAGGCRDRHHYSIRMDISSLFHRDRAAISGHWDAVYEAMPPQGRVPRGRRAQIAVRDKTGARSAVFPATSAFRKTVSVLETQSE